MEKKKREKCFFFFFLPLAALYIEPTFTAKTPDTDDTNTMLAKPEALNRG